MTSDLEARVNRLEAEVRDLRTALQVTRQAAERGFGGTTKSLEFSAGLIQRLLTGQDTDTRKAVVSLAHLRKDVEASWAQFRVISGSAADQEAGLQQLAGKLRPEESLEFIGEIEVEASVGKERIRRAVSDFEERLEVDLLLITATATETRAVIQAFDVDLEAIDAHPTRNHLYYRLGTHGEAEIALVESAMGSGGPNGSGITSYEGIDKWSPAWVVQVGLAFGVDETKQQIGDVLVSRKLQPYELMRIGQTDVGELKIEDRNPRPLASHGLLSRFCHQAVLAKHSIEVGTVLTGEKLVDNIDYRNYLTGIYPDAIGGEMEGAGLWAGADAHQVDWIVVKAICDWADGNKGTDKAARQALAAAAAANVVAEVVGRKLLKRPSKSERA